VLSRLSSILNVTLTHLYVKYVGIYNGMYENRRVGVNVMIAISRDFRQLFGEHILNHNIGPSCKSLKLVNKRIYILIRDPILRLQNLHLQRQLVVG
jgi:hypothetical protein